MKKYHVLSTLAYHNGKSAATALPGTQIELDEVDAENLLACKAVRELELPAGKAPTAKPDPEAEVV